MSMYVLLNLYWLVQFSFNVCNKQLGMHYKTERNFPHSQDDPKVSLPNKWLSVFVEVNNQLFSL